MDLDLLSFVLGCVLGGLVGYRIANHIHQQVMPDLFKRVGITPKKLEQVMQDLRKEIDGEPADQEINIVVESVNGRLYVYRKETSEFLAQGVTDDEVLTMLKSKFTEARFAVTKEDGADFLGLVKNNPTS